MSDSADIIVIGAGLAGLTLARNLMDGGLNVTVIEKAKGPGGRLSTRRSDCGSFDHGAQYLTSRTPKFTDLLNQLAQTHQSAAWTPSGKDSTRPWWVGKPGMSTLGKALAQGIDVKFATRATRIEKTEDGQLIVHSQSNDGTEVSFSAKRLVAAIPAPQVATLFEPFAPDFAALNQVKMAPCWSAMLAFETSLSIVQDLTRGQTGEVLALMTRNGSKPGRTGETFVLHATPDWSRRHLEDDRETVKAAMLEAMRSQTGLGADLPEPVHMEVHRWRYAMVERPLGRPFLGNDYNTLFACGDWCLDARAEAAHQSGLALARHILSL